MDAENVCRCGKPTRDAAFVCDPCGDDVAKALGEVPWLTEQLEISVTSQQGVDYRRAGGSTGGKKPTERPSPVSWGPADARAHLRAILVAWTLFCDQEHVRNSSPYPGLPDDDLPALSRWLMWRVDGLTLVEIGADAVDEITSAVAHCHRLIDRPADRQYLGPCQEQDCEGRMYARPRAAFAHCAGCGTPVSADEIRTRLIGELDDRLCTAAEIARLSTYLGLKADREQVRKRINQWHRRGLLATHPSITDEITFRFGEVYTRLAADEYGARKRVS